MAYLFVKHIADSFTLTQSCAASLAVVDGLRGRLADSSDGLQFGLVSVQAGLGRLPLPLSTFFNWRTNLARVRLSGCLHKRIINDMTNKRLLDFKPPKPNRAVIGLCQTLFAGYLAHVAKLSLVIEPASRPVLNSLGDKTVVFFMNHPDRQDPLAIIALADYLREPLFTVVAREVFDWDHGMRGWLFQHIGCYSVTRGAIDVRSIRTTSKLLKDGGHKLMVFPEAHITGDNDTVHELQSSFVHILLDTQTEIMKRGKSNDIHVVPVSVRYTLDTDLESSLSNLMWRIEKKLGLENENLPAMRQRVTNAAVELLKSLSHQCGLLTHSSELTKWSLELVDQICTRMSLFVGVDARKYDSRQQWLHCLRHAISKHIELPVKEGAYQRGNKLHCDKIYRRFLADLDRIERLMILHRITRHELNDIQVCRIADFLECETLGRMTAKGHQSATLQVGQPIEVRPYAELYRASKAAAIRQLTIRSQRELQSALSGDNTIAIAGEAEAQAS